jgi:hypothetical protein
MPQKTTSILGTTYVKKAQINLHESKRASIGIEYVAHATGTNGKAELYFHMIHKGRISGAETDIDLGVEVELASAAGKYTLNNNKTYETGTASNGASAAVLPVWDNRICDTIDAVDVYVKETGDVANRGTVKINYSVT